MDVNTKSAISKEDYLRTSFEGLDREYVDGEIVERTLPNFLHSKTQWRLSGLIWELSKTLPSTVVPSCDHVFVRREFGFPTFLFMRARAYRKRSGPASAGSNRNPIA